MWYCLKRRRRYKPDRLAVGRWYEGVREPAMKRRIPKAYVRVDDEEVEVPLGDLMVRWAKPDYSYAYYIASGNFDMSWVPVCPEGHQGPSTTGGLQPETHDCKECGEIYPVRTAG